MKSDEFHTISRKVETEIKIKDSRFIAYASPVVSRERAESCYLVRKARFADATHNCFAYKVGSDDLAIWRANDDGEPAGTAGKPILQAIEGQDLTNLIVVVSRYFGGTKLGVGGLIRAYGDAARSVLNKTSRIIKYNTVDFKLVFSYNITNAITKQIAKFQGKIIKSDYHTETCLQVKVRRSFADPFESSLVDVSSGKIHVSRLI